MKQLASAQRYTDIDKLRGYLIVLVIIGHIVLGSVHENFIRYSIYAFHMPLFIGLSGYLINAESLRKAPFFSTLMRYWWRVILPFGFAFAFYTGILLFHAYEEGRVTAKLMLSYIHTPYYHLWFVPTLVLWVLAFAGFLKLKVPLSAVLIAFLLSSLVWAGVSKADFVSIVAALLSKKVIYFFGFFLFGAWLRTSASVDFRRVFTSFRVLPIALVLLCAVPYLLNIGAEKSWLKAVSWLVLNLSLITVLIQAAVTGKQSKPSIVSEIGRNSLPIYLWHMLPMFLLKGFDIHQSNVLIYYAVAVISTLFITLVILRLEGKSKLSDRCLFGVG